MALIKVDWNPDARKLRQFGVGLLVFAAVVAGMALYKGRPASAQRALGFFSALGLLTLALPRAGILIYKAWMSAAFVIGTVVSTALLALLYYAVLTPLALLLRLSGRDALQLKRGSADTYWNVLKYPLDPAYFERLF